MEIKKTDKLANEKEEKGVTMVEYAILAALIAVVCILAIRTLGRQVSSNFSNISAQIQS